MKVIVYLYNSRLDGLDSEGVQKSRLRHAHTPSGTYQKKTYMNSFHI